MLIQLTRYSTALLSLLLAWPVIASEQPPDEYNLSDTKLVLEHSIHTRLMRFYDSSTIEGDGLVTYKRKEQDQETSAATNLSKEEVRQILRQAYEIRLFTLQEFYISKAKLEFEDDGHVYVRGSMANHQLKTQITIQIGEFTKIVQFGSHGSPPSELVEFAKMIQEILHENGLETGVK